MSSNSMCHVFVVDNSRVGVAQCCKVCGKILDSGKYVIGIHIIEGNQKFRYLLGIPEDIQCCGESKKLVMTFEGYDEADTEVQKTIKRIQQTNSTSGLKLLNFVIVPHQSKFN